MKTIITRSANHYALARWFTAVVRLLAQTGVYNSRAGLRWRRSAGYDLNRARLPILRNASNRFAGASAIGTGGSKLVKLLFLCLFTGFSLSVFGEERVAAMQSMPAILSETSYYTVRASDYANGKVYMSTDVTRQFPVALVNLGVKPGGSISFTAVPNPNYEVDRWVVNGFVIQKGGATHTFSNVQTNLNFGVLFSYKRPLPVKHLAQSTYTNGNIQFVLRGLAGAIMALRCRRILSIGHCSPRTQSPPMVL